MNEQAQGLGLISDRELTSLPFPLVFLTGGKGGVGKTSLTLNLGIALAKTGLRVLIVDLDLGLSNLNVLTKVNPTRTLEDFFSGEADLAECIVEAPGGIHMICGSSGSTEMGRPDRARRARLFDGLAVLQGSYDVVLGDSPAGIGPDVLAFAAAADFVLTVATPEPASITDAYGVLKALDVWGSERGVEVPTPALVLNRVSGSAEAEALSMRLAKVSRRFLSRSPRLVGWIPDSRAVHTGAIAQRPFVLSEPRSLPAQCVSRLAARIAVWASPKTNPLSC